MSITICNKTWMECHDCGGQGFTHHECGEDTCACLDVVNNVICYTCNGKGGWHVCPD